MRRGQCSFFAKASLAHEGIVQTSFELISYYYIQNQYQSIKPWLSRVPDCMITVREKQCQYQ